MLGAKQPHCTLAACSSGRDPHCVLSLPLPGRGHRSLLCPALRVGSRPPGCNRPGLLCLQALLCLRHLCPPRVPGAPGARMEGRFPLDSRLVPAVPSPTSGAGSQSAVPWVPKGLWAGWLGRWRPVRGAAGLGEEVWGTRPGPQDRQVKDPLHLPGAGAPLGRLPGLGATGTEPGKLSMHRTLHQSTGSSTENAGCLLGFSDAACTSICVSPMPHGRDTSGQRHQPLPGVLRPAWQAVRGPARGNRSCGGRRHGRSFVPTDRLGGVGQPGRDQAWFFPGSGLGPGQKASWAARGGRGLDAGGWVRVHAPLRGAGGVCSAGGAAGSSLSAP